MGKKNLINDMNEKVIIGSNISKMRKSASVSQQALADIVGIQQAHLSRIENGKFMPRVDIVSRIAKALGCTIDELVG